MIARLIILGVPAALVTLAQADDAPPAPPPPAEVEGEVIVVTGTREEKPREASPIATEVIDRKRLAESGVQTVSEALAMRPGLWIERGVAGTSGVTMQGLGPQYSLVLVDGARQIGRTDGVLDLDRFALEDLEQIEIVRGPASVLYGSDALGGVINLVTRTPKDGLAVDGLARIDGRLGYEARARVAGGTRGYSGSLVGSYRTAPEVVMPGQALATIIDGYEDAHVTGHASHRRGETWRFDAAADYVQRDLRGVDATATGAVFDRRNLVETAMWQLGARYTSERTAVRIETDASLYRDQFLDDQRMSDALDTYNLTDENLVETRVQIARQLTRRHRALAGGELLREALDSDRLVAPGSRTRGALYAQDEIKLDDVDRLILVPAGRIDADTQFGFNATPRLAARWQATERAVVRGSAGMGYRAPSFKEMLLRFQNPGAGYVVEGNPDLGPETSVSVQTGVEWQPEPWLWLGADAYVNQLRDLIFVVTLPDDGSGLLRFGYDNIGRARTAGAEAHAIATYGRAALELGYAHTYTRDLDAGRALEGIPAHRATATLRFRDRRDRLDAFATAVMTGARPFYLDDTTARSERRVELRARVGKRFASGFGGFLGIDNALDTGDPRFDRIPPRTLYAGVEVHR